MIKCFFTKRTKMLQLQAALSVLGCRLILSIWQFVNKMAGIFLRHCVVLQGKSLVIGTSSEFSMAVYPCVLRVQCRRLQI